MTRTLFARELPTTTGYGAYCKAVKRIKSIGSIDPFDARPEGVSPVPKMWGVGEHGKITNSAQKRTIQ